LKSLIYPEIQRFTILTFTHVEFDQPKRGDWDQETETPGLYLGLFKHWNILSFRTDRSEARFTKGVISHFLYKIPPIGTKFHLAEEMAPQRTKGPMEFLHGEIQGLFDDTPLFDFKLTTLKEIILEKISDIKTLTQIPIAKPIKSIF